MKELERFAFKVLGGMLAVAWAAAPPSAFTKGLALVYVMERFVTASHGEEYTQVKQDIGDDGTNTRVREGAAAHVVISGA